MVNLKCDETCKGGDNCTNSRIYISGLPKGCTADDITDMFGGLGTIARERPQGRGVFPDMMPYRVKFYGNDDCLLHYEDPHAAHAAPSFFDGQELKGSKLHVEMAEKKPNQGLPAGYYIPPEAKGQSYGGGGGAGRGGGPPRGNYGPPGGNYGGGGGYGGPRRDDRRGGGDYGRRDDRRDYDRRDRRDDYGRDRSRRSRSRDRDRDRRGYGGDRGRDRRSRSRSRGRRRGGY
jgi:RNA recognition motif-containing protein